MTDTEAKALAWATQWESEFVTPYPPGRRAALVKIFYEQLRAQEATEARHAAELREQAERFSEAAEKALYQMRANQLLQASVQPTLAPFILPAPDPLAELAQEAFSAMLRANSPDGLTEALHAALTARGYEVRKIEHTQPAGGSDATI